MVIDDKKPMEVPMILEVLDASATNPDAPYGYWECLTNRNQLWEEPCLVKAKDEVAGAAFRGRDRPL